jgi:hypothetical protein
VLSSLRQEGVHVTRFSGYSIERFVLPHGRLPGQCGRMTWTKLNRLIKAGFGQGHFNDYRPWLRITKKDYSPVGNIGHLPSPDLGHKHHYRSCGEKNLILVLKWLGAADARDQYPVWPWPHPHPVYGLPGYFDPTRVIGLWEIAAAAGITHGFYAGSDVPYIATIDILSTWQHSAGTYYLIAHEVKPYEYVYEPDPLSRSKERLELTRRYCVAVNIPQRIAHAENISLGLIRNLDALAPRLKSDDLQRVRSSKAYLRIVEHCLVRAYDRPAFLAAEEARGSIPKEASHELLKLAIWFQDVDHDISQELELWQPLILGGHSQKQALMAEWHGDTL